MIHLRTYSEYSLLYSAARASELGSFAFRQGMEALGVVDRFQLFGLPAVARALEDQQVRPLLGMTVRIAPTLEERDRRRALLQISEVSVLAQSDEGYRQLMRLASSVSLDPLDLKRISEQTLFENTRGLLCLTGDREGPVEVALSQNEEQRALRSLSALIEAFGRDAVYIEMARSGQADERERGERLQALARKIGLPIVGTSPVRHMTPPDIRLLDVLAGVEQGITLAEAAALRPRGASFHFRSQEEMETLFADCPAALATTVEVADRCRAMIPSQSFAMPRYALPERMTEAQALEKLAYDRLTRRVTQPTDVYTERLRYELAVIERMGFSGYFLIVWDFMRFARRQGITTGPGRGSAAGSLVSYVLSITDVDPIVHDLLFERFLNPERVSWPDIDIDFETERRHEVVSYVAMTYGLDHVAHIGTLGTFASRAAVRDVARVLGVAAGSLQPLLDALPSIPGTTLAGALREDAALAQRVARDPTMQRVVQFALGIEGLPRHTSIHAAGVVISPRPLTDLVPLMAGADEVRVTQYAMEDVEALGLLKMDFLGLKTLTLCDRTIRYIRDVRGESVHVEALTLNEATIELLSQGDTDGCFQLESPGVKHVLREMKPRNLEDLIAVISLYRPGPMEQIPAFLRARSGTVAPRYEVPELEPILRSTFGILVYQEQIMQIASRLAGFSLGEADVLRRAVSKKKRDVLDEWRGRFLEGCASRGVIALHAERVYDLIVRFADYGFNRSHAAAYALLAVRTAALKANYRPEFMSALMNEQMARPDKLAHYASACRRAGIAVLPPDINLSGEECRPERTLSGAVAIRLSLEAIKYVGNAAVRHLLELREAGAFLSVRDLLLRSDSRVLTRRVTESLVQAGALDSLGGRNAMLYAVKQWFDERELPSSRGKTRLTKNASESALSLFDDDVREALRDNPAEAAVGKVVANDPVTLELPEQCDAWERELIGFVVSRDPFSELIMLRETARLPDLARAKERAKKEPTDVVARLLHVRQTKTRRGEPMAFLQVEDESDRAEVVLFPSLFRTLREEPTSGRLCFLQMRTDARSSGLVAMRFSYTPPEGVGVSVSSPPVALTQVVDARATSAKRLWLRIDQELDHSVESLRALREILVRYPGDVPVILSYSSGQNRLLESVRVDLSKALARELLTLLSKNAIRVTDE
ncbi:hypothetical protein AYW79_06815 [Ferroacidibacillus organovorans]|uniref:DNA-directed DNA polymerase n=1 Tax=Ferroacidibacillus organovorans TaxID=1765683 RepID=A0A853KFJ1_9BACL|nr:DNA polymerase III subunit alpha [Ferroacidibacillus organovorans]OAG94130.1 hypothetical protein AYW79_06815 [Ferroacidibacillus organovorans]